MKWVNLQTSICNICLKSGFLCQGCDSKLKEGKISELEVKISRILFELSKNHRGLEHLNLKKTVSVGDLIILVVGRGQIPLIIGRGGSIVKEIQRLLKAKVRAVEEGATPKKLAQDILAPAEVLGINVLYAKSGKEFRVVVPRRYMRLLSKNEEKIKSTLSMLTDKNFTIVFE